MSAVVNAVAFGVIVLGGWWLADRIVWPLWDQLRAHLARRTAERTARRLAERRRAATQDAICRTARAKGALR